MKPKPTLMYTVCLLVSANVTIGQMWRDRINRTPDLHSFGVGTIASDGLAQRADQLFQNSTSEHSFKIQCAFCSNSVFTNCDTNEDCPAACDSDDTVNCEVDPCPVGGSCLPGQATCIAPPNCQSGACCLTSGECVFVGSDAECTAVEGEFQGLGTDCSPNCCTQPTPSGGDNCTLVSLVDIDIPVLDDPAVIKTISGNTGAATFDEYPLLTDSKIFNPSGGTRDPGWWEGFNLIGAPNACADVRVDFCCTNCECALRPARRQLWAGCPSHTVLGSLGVDPPVGDTRNGQGFGRGMPFCDSENLWATFQALRPGQYYYPIASDCPRFLGQSCDYQLHVTVLPCPVSACCTGDTCAVMNQLDCADLGGRWLYPNVGCGNLPSENPCRIGSCCLGGGACEDRSTPNLDMCDLLNPETCMTAEFCTGQFVGGVLCINTTDPCPQCPKALMPVSDFVDRPQDLAKLRALALSIDEEQNTAIRVEFTALAPPFDTGNGLLMWVGEPFSVCENSGQVNINNPGTCLSPPCPTPHSTTYAELQCGPLFRDWSNDGVINIVHEYIVPASTYTVQAIRTGCPIGEEQSYSEPLTIQTPVWGDVGGSCSPPECKPPDGTVDITTDVTACLDKFKNAKTGARKARVDVEGSGTGLIDFVINIADVTYILSAFQQDPYPFLPGPVPCVGPAR